MDIGVVPSPPKIAPIKMKRRHNLPAEVHSLVQKYFKLKEMQECEEENYMVVGSDNKMYC